LHQPLARNYLYIVEVMNIFMERKDLVRGAVVLGICLGVLVYNWGSLAWPMHRGMALLVMTAVFSLAWFYELTMRDAPIGRVLVGLLAIMGGAVVLWLALALFVHPLPNDSTPLLPASETMEVQSCAAPPGALTALVGADQIVGRSKGAFTPFKISSCPGPGFSATLQGLVVDDFGYDGDGSVIFKIRRNLFDLMLGDYLHVHRADRSTLGLYDRWEREILYVRYLNPGTIRVRGRFLCGDYPPVTVKEDSVTVGDTRFSQPSCLLDRQRRY
jgi:hypothetical protein